MTLGLGVATLALGLVPAASPFDVLDSCFVVETSTGAVGTGFLVEPDLIATAAHVVQGSNGVRLSTAAPSARQLAGEVVFVDVQRDVALIQLTGPPNLPVLSLARELPLPGATVYAIGSPIGELVASRGAVTRVEGGLIESDAPVDPGSSGGPLIDEAGAVRGLVVKQGTFNGHAFAVPSSVVSTVIESWRESGGQGSASATDFGRPRSGAWPVAMWSPIAFIAVGAVALILIGITRRRRLRRQPARIVIRMDEEHRNV
ncbi:MAG: trypsin-like peptidase domain-containing protein [Actinobacteria bacterium]|nr:trypsin-like peptidase domain-containing protein [Actinomycetota bacterium]